MYISTIAVEPACRNRGIGRRLYEALIAMAPHDRDTDLLVRTWSTNTGHIALLESMGFVEVRRLRNDRGDGIDTVYFARRG